MKDIIETAVRMDANLDAVTRSERKEDSFESNDSAPSGIYLHNQTSAADDAWLPAVVVCDRYGIDLETLRAVLKAKNADEPGTKDLKVFKEFTPISTFIESAGLDSEA